MNHVNTTTGRYTGRCLDLPIKRLRYSAGWYDTFYRSGGNLLILSLIFALSTLPISSAIGQAANLDQVRNGKYDNPVSPGNFQNGNLGFQNAHFIEGYSVPYRAVMTGLTPGVPVSLEIGFDIKHSGKHALDYITSYDRLEPHIFFGHDPETIDPTVGTGVVGGAVYADIPPPIVNKNVTIGVITKSQPLSSYNDLSADEKKMALWGGNFAASNAIVYSSGGNLDVAQSQAIIVVSFTPTASTAVLAWGGHIASRLDWGDPITGPNSAGGISGSPYHMRLLDWNLNNLGNQDRSLKADAVFAPPLECQVTPLVQNHCEGGNATITAAVAEGTGAGPFTYELKKGSTMDATIQTIGPTALRIVEFQLNNVALADAGRYYVVITDNFGTTCHDFGDLNVFRDPSVSVAAQNVCSGGSATFRANITNLQAGVSYSIKWHEFNAAGTPLGAGTAGTIQSDAMGYYSTFTVNNATATTRYGAVVIDDEGMSCNGQGYNTLTVYDDPAISVGAQNACKGGSVIFRADITNLQAGINYTIRWHEFNAAGTPLGAGTAGTIQSDAIGYYSTYTVNNISANAYYGAVVVDSDGKGCDGQGYNTLTAYDDPTVTVGAEAECEDGSATFRADLANLVPGYTYSISWHEFNAAGTPLGAGTAGTIQSDATGYYSTFTVNNITSNGYYGAVIADTGGKGCDGQGYNSLTVMPCSKIELEKLTDGLVDPSMLWSFTISEGDLEAPVTESVLNDADGILFDGLVLSRYETYKICETNVGSGFNVVIQYYDSEGVLQDVPWFDPDVVNGGGDFNQGEAMGNYCFYIGAGTDLELPANTADATEPIRLRIRINNIPPPGGDARTPGYWKNWNSCTQGNQYNNVMEARANGGDKADFWLLDDHLPHILWQTASARYEITSCQEAVLILDERQVTGKNQKLASDAAYKLAKHLLTYQLNKKSGTYECASAAAAAVEAEGLLASLNFRGTLSSYLSNKGKGGGGAQYARALELAKTLDAYNNNLPCGAGARTIADKESAPASLDSKLRISTYPNPFRGATTLEFSSPVKQGVCCRYIPWMAK
ncbi:immunoglobulin domain-containing protein [Cesiribacter andamanensis]|uniref:Ig-like domain-containing protein n=1 Tax=Cesiribacter andamanensis AMV16 TaxID=1279009 RepID=M7P0H3_9BACT|nr:hypothetical protein [Cesiribacter andamanensis]EMR04099.1 hypothetical protein ADICEAN_00722 [Cesiribacter andamanensis AMV16]